MGNKAYKFRLYPNRDQQAFLAKCFGCSRFVYNYFLRLTTDVYAECKKNLRYKEWAKLLTQLKKEFEWLKEVNSQSLQQTVKDLETSYVRFFKGLAKFPRFKKRSNKQYFRVPQHFSITEDSRYAAAEETSAFRRTKHRLKLPKMTSIKMVVHRKIEGNIKSVTISKTPSEKYFASIVTELEISKAPLNGGKIGLDLGLKDFVITSKPEKFPNPRYFERSLRRLKIRQRRLSRKVKGSNNRNNSRIRVAKIYEKVANQRADYQHKISLKLTCENQAISCEDLNIKGSVKNRKLAKQISDVAWGQFLTLLEYKGELYGCEIFKVDRFFPSSKRCSNCGYIKEDLTLKDRQWDCVKCNTSHDRDINACVNLLQFSKFKIGQEVSKSTPKETVETLCIRTVTT